MRTIAICLLAATGLGAAAGCGDDAGDPGGAAGEAAAQRELLVFAAASLTDAFTELGESFEQAAGASVQFNFGASSALREQILEGAPAHVFASVDRANVQAVLEAGEAAGDPVVFARNSLQIAVPAGNPGEVRGLEDFAVDAKLIGLCAPQVPCGKLARQALAYAGVEPSLDTEEPDVRALLTKLEAGELDAGIVYRTDVLAAGEAVEGIEIPAEHNVVAELPIVLLNRALEVPAGAAFVEFVLSSAGQEILARHGFRPA